jgi:hypothetical protein
LLDVRGRDLAFHRRIGGKNYLADNSAAYPLHQPIKPQGLGPDSVKRREVAAKHMIMTAKVGRAVDHGHCRGLLNHTDQAGISSGIATDGAGLLFSEIATFLTGLNPLGYRGED